MVRPYFWRIIRPYNPNQPQPPSLLLCPYSLLHQKIAISRYFGNGKIVVILQRQKM